MPLELAGDEQQHVFADSSVDHVDGPLSVAGRELCFGFGDPLVSDAAMGAGSCHITVAATLPHLLAATLRAVDAVQTGVGDRAAALQAGGLLLAVR